jgi:hypothetical protein
MSGHDPAVPPLSSMALLGHQGSESKAETVPQMYLGHSTGSDSRKLSCKSPGFFGDTAHVCLTLKSGAA